MTKFKSGDKVVFGKGKLNKALPDITIGKIYNVFSCDGELVFFDDVEDLFYLLGTDEMFKATKIVD